MAYLMNEQQVHAQIMDRLGRAMSGRQAPYVEISELASSLDVTIADIVRETMSAIGGGPEGASAFSVDYLDQEYRQTAEANARHNVHPAEALMLAELIFNVALPVLAEWSSSSDVLLVEICRRLHRSIWKRFPPGAINYTNYIRRRLYEVEREAKVAVARELHDQTSHRLLVLVHKIELEQLCAVAVQHASLLAEMEAELRVAIDEVRELATTLRRQLNDLSLGEAIKFHAAQIARGIRVTVAVEGDTSKYAVWQQEELLSIVLEAIRNAVRHGSPNSISVHIVEDSQRLSIDVVDTGNGLGVDAKPGLGIQGMRERADLLGAAMQIKRSERGGTHLRLEVEEFTRMGRALRDAMWQGW